MALKVNSSTVPEAASAVDDLARRAMQKHRQDDPTKSSRENIDRRSIVLGIEEQSQVRLGVEMNLFSRTGDAFPIVNVLSGTPFHNLRVRGNVTSKDNDDVVLEDASTQTPVTVVHHSFENNTETFKIYSARPVYSGQSPADLCDYDHKLYSFAAVERGDEMLDVVLEGQSSPTFTIHNYQIVSSPSFPTTHLVLDKLGEEVASSRSGEGHSYAVLTVKAGVDPCLMICLAAIADEARK